MKRDPSRYSHSLDAITGGQQHYDWERFWVDSRVRSQIGADDFFQDPRAEPTWLRPNIDAVSLNEASSASCLILLGEPGLGKSQAVKDAVRELAESPERPLHQMVDLGVYSDPGSIRAKLIEGEPWEKWLTEGRTFHLFLDSVDEAMLQFSGVGDFLIEELRNASGSLSNLRLRVACRSADWTSGLTDGLKDLGRGGGESTVRELSLAPLREIDIRSAADAEGLDAAAFIREIRQRDLESLASLPLTAAMLLRIAKEDSVLPETRLDLYSRGVAMLLREDNPRRRRVETPTTGAAERRGIAEWLGTVLLLSRHHAIALNPLHAGRGEIDPAVFDGRRIRRSATDPTSITLGEQPILETLSTALFVKAGPEAVAFAHRSLAEFCAGACLAVLDADPGGLLDLLFVDEAGGRLIPQLREVAAWAAAQSAQVLAIVLGSEPEVLLRVDRLDLPEERRSEVIEALLNIESAERLNRWDQRIWRSLASLKHPDIAEQLTPIVLDRGRHWSVRQLGITILRACEAGEAEGALLELAQDSSESAWMRDDAVLALGDFGSARSRRALVHLALKPIEDDVDDQIKGAALEAVFPDFVSTEDVLKSLTPPRNRNLIGAYSSFLHTGFARSLPTEDLPVALRWVQRLPIHDDRLDRLQGLADEIIATAWPLACDSDEIAELLAAVALPRLKAHVGILTSYTADERREVIGEPLARRRMVEVLVPRLPAAGVEVVSFVVSSPRLIERVDLPWALGHLKAAIGTNDEDAWAEVVRFIAAPPFEGQELEELYALTTENPGVDEHVGFVLSPIELDSDLARSLRENHRANTEAERVLPDRHAELDDEIDTYLHKSENGDEEAWWRLNWVLQFDDAGQGAANVDFEADLTVFPGWRRATKERQGRIAASARRAIRGSPPDIDTWFSVNTINRPAVAGYRALHLIALLGDGSTEEIPPDAWARWMPIVVDFPRYDSTEDRLHDELLRAAGLGDPDSFTAWSIRKIDAEEEKDEGHLWFVRRLEGVAPQAFLDALVERVSRPQIRPSAITDLLIFLLAEEPEATIRAVRPRLTAAQGSDLSGEERKRVARIAAALLGVAPAVAWQEVADLFEANPEVGRDSFAAVTDLERDSIATTMPDDHLGAFTTWVYREFPESSDPPVERDAHYVGTRESIGQFRRGLLDALCERGTDSAVEAVEKLYEKYGTGNLRFAARRAREARDSNTPAPSPVDVVRVLAGEGRDPRDAADLQRIVLRALGRVQRSLRAAQPPASPELWNTRPTNTPKDEGELSNWLAPRLEAGLGPRIAVTRESLLSGGGKGRGQSGDILITASSPQAGERLRLLIEAKGSWEANVRSRMNTQLASEYMRKTGIEHAIYLVFWFDRSKWDPEDYRYARSTFSTAESARHFFNEQARDLSQSGPQIRAVVLDGSLP